MALFNKKIRKKEEVLVEKTTKEKKKKVDSSPSSPIVFLQKDYSGVLRSPRITEKATILSEKGVYVFEVDVKATKYDIARVIEDLYKVKPVKINIVQIPPKKIRLQKRGVFGTKSGGKKAYVYLKKGDTIEIV